MLEARREGGRRTTRVTRSSKREAKVQRRGKECDRPRRGQGRKRTHDAKRRYEAEHKGLDYLQRSSVVDGAEQIVGRKQRMRRMTSSRRAMASGWTMNAAGIEQRKR